ncbi:TPR domain-containing protein [Psychromonas hadalis]|uniref:TPR domain-containing protein n=1 Tax=Psychromonas hadalis TaxID=211669 RepID=UPI0003B48500|nr:tetratricopeptide repeat protein [Psychromonas hadalis]
MTVNKWPILLSSVLMVGSLSGYAWLGSYPKLLNQNKEQVAPFFESLSPQEIRSTRITALQEKLYQDKQNGQLWYQLGHAYLLNGEYKKAVTVFDYAIRLTDAISSDHYASKATALYYHNKQQMGNEINDLIASALAIDENNQTALMMLANEQFMQARYQQAINLWVKILDSDQAGLDRVGIIHRINQAKLFLR